MKVYIASDHAGYEMKEAIKNHFSPEFEWEDLGTHSSESVDYPDYGYAVAKAVAAGEADKGIVVCTTGIGISITANKVPGIRCALCSETTSARLTREHNDANVLAMGGGLVGPLLGCEIADVFLDTPFSEAGKHVRRVNRIAEIERQSGLVPPMNEVNE